LIIEKRANFHLLQAVPRGKGRWQKCKGDNRKAEKNTEWKTLIYCRLCQGEKKMAER
jgi:hypothetical protein